MPAQLLVGPWAPSGKKTIVAIGVRRGRPAIVMPSTIVDEHRGESEADERRARAEHVIGAERDRDARNDAGASTRRRSGIQRGPASQAAMDVALDDEAAIAATPPDERAA